MQTQFYWTAWYFWNNASGMWVLKYYVFETNISEMLVPIWNLKLVSLGRGQERLKKDVWHSRLVGDSFIRQRIHMRRVLCCCKTSRLLHLPCQNLISLYKWLNWVQLHVMSRWSQQHIDLSKLCHCKWLTIDSEGSKRWWGVSDCPGPAQESTSKSHPVDDLLQQEETEKMSFKAK